MASKDAIKDALRGRRRVYNGKCEKPLGALMDLFILYQHS